MAVYLLHFNELFKHAKHYLGYANDVEHRLDQHQHGCGARLMEVVVQAGITFELARTWPGDRSTERKLKGYHSGCKLCPICNPKLAHLRVEHDVHPIERSAGRR